MTEVTSQQLALMKTFLRVVSAGSLSLAAKQVCTSQPTVSRQLRNLEDHLGIQLINRTTQGITLTEIGKRYYGYVKELVEDLEEFEDELRGCLSIPTGILRVMVPHGFCENKLVKVAAQYLADYPETRLEWKFGDSEVQFGDGAIDCAIILGKPKDDLLIARSLCEINMSVVAAPALLAKHDKIETPEDLLALPWVSMSNQNNYKIDLQNQYGNISQLNILPNFMPGSTHAVWQAAMLGIGAALLPNCYASNGEASGSLVRVLPEWSTELEHIHLVYPRARHYSSKLRKFIDQTLALPAGFFLSHLVDDTPNYNLVPIHAREDPFTSPTSNIQLKAF